ncbi:MAG: hypothetical protein IJV56_07510 [Neisseriaceae bacterium]|nr:hypothetical protein [Neisseriaceae bacterium]
MAKNCFRQPENPENPLLLQKCHKNCCILCLKNNKTTNAINILKNKQKQHEKPHSITQGNKKNCK